MEMLEELYHGEIIKARLGSPEARPQEGRWCWSPGDRQPHIWMSYSSSGTRSRAAAETPPASLTCPPWTSSPPPLSTAGTSAGTSTKYVREKQQDVKLRQNTTRASTSMSQHSRDVSKYVTLTEQKGRQQLCHRTVKTSTVMWQNTKDVNNYVTELQGRH